jgi:5-methylthioadenosine/S-adenosylhomocysteine deaminase
MATHTILGKYLITSAHDEPKFNWGLRIESNRIVEIGPNENLKKKYGTSFLTDATDKIIMPGFINTHIHMYGMLAHGMPSNTLRTDLYYDLVDMWWPRVEDQMDHEALHVSAQLAAAASIRSGVTTICDVMEAPYALPGCLDVAGKALDEAGIRAVLCFEATERVSEKNAQMGLDENVNFIRNNPSGKGRLTGMMCVHTTFSCSLPFLKKGRKLADKLGSFIHMHLSESRYEALHCLRTYGKLPFEVYEEIGFLGKDVLASQCVHVRAREIPIMAKYGVNVSHQPMSNADPGCGVAPVPIYLVNGIRVGLGSDGHNKNHFEVLRSAIHIHRAHLVDGTVMSPKTVFEIILVR